MKKIKKIILETNGLKTHQRDLLPNNNIECETTEYVS